MKIEDLLRDIPDKTEVISTTSHKFKTDLWNFFADDKFKELTAIEVGTFNGQTSKIMSYLFKNVHTVNNNPSLRAKELNADRTNIEYHMFDVYGTFPWPTNDITADIVLIDAIHNYDSVRSDIFNSSRMPSIGKKYYIFDDYGMNVMIESGVKRAIDESIADGEFEIIAEIGHEAGFQFADGKVLEATEGIICVEK